MNRQRLWIFPEPGSYDITASITMATTTGIRVSVRNDSVINAKGFIL
jgi:hypothetical protein